ncbi:MAG: diphthine--ammonia ligase [Nanoarchaeota archaeon]|nr:MAG: diphthine--ammonia ligase [Nanoarchaeota archaeon]
MRIGALFSGGKDSMIALDWLEKRGHDIVCLLTVISESDESYMFHFPNVEWTAKQAEALKIPQLIRKTKGVKEEELEDLKELIKEAKEKYSIEAVSAGALASSYQRDRVVKICNELGLVSFTPYWQHNDGNYMKIVLDSGYEIILVGVFADGLTADLLGRRLDVGLLQKLKEIKKKTGIHLAGEGGEYETFVLDGPMFRKRLEIVDSEIVKERNSAVLKIKEIILIDK